MAAFLRWCGWVVFFLVGYTLAARQSVISARSFGYVLMGVAFLFIFARSFKGQQADRVRKGADRLQSTMSKLYVAEHEIVAARLEDFPHLDHAYYAGIVAQAKALGFDHLADLEIRTVSAAGAAMPVLLRSCTNHRGTVLFGYHSRMPGLLLKLLKLSDAKVIDFDTDLSDGTALCTSTAWIARHLKQPPSIQTRHHPPSTAMEALWADHEQTVQAYVSAHPGVHVLPCDTAEQLIEGMHRSHRIKAAFRANHALSREELQALAADNPIRGATEAADELADELGRRGPGTV